MSECIEIDGQPRSYFLDGSKRMTYRTIALAAKHPATVTELSAAFFGQIEKIRARSTKIVWRLRPRPSYQVGNELSGPSPSEEWAEAYSEGKAKALYRCRLVCYPPLTDGELEQLAIKEEGDPVQQL